MSVLPVGFGSALGGYQIERSLRFNSADSAYLNRTPASAGNRTTWTWSAWVKRSLLTSRQMMFGVWPTSGRTDSNTITFEFDVNDRIRVAGGLTQWLLTNAVFRDTASWYHVQLTIDTTSATTTDRVIVYVNGVRQTTNAYSAPSQNLLTGWGLNGSPHFIGSLDGASIFLGGYLTEVNFVDGQALTPSSFGETDSNTGVWKPKAYTSTYGTNGFELFFSDNSNTTAATLGKDSSGNGNNWTPNNFSVTAGAGNDSLVDSPTSYGTDTGVGGSVRGNYCTLNALVKPASVTLSNGNLDVTLSTSSGNRSIGSTFYQSTGSWYWESVATTVGNNSAGIGIANDSFVFGNEGGTGCYFYLSDGRKVINNVYSAYGASYVANDVIGVAFDATNGTITFYKNGSSQGQITGIPTGVLYAPFVCSNTSVTASVFVTNFGQRAFAYTAPSGFKALCTQNLPTPTIGATSTTQANDYFNVVTYTATENVASSITGVGFQPDFVWVKTRADAASHALTDAVRGVQKGLFSNTSGAEVTSSTYLTSFDSDGFTQGGAGNFARNSLVAWNWKANGAGSSNTAGTITSTVSANTTSGFSIVTWTCTGANATVGHGLGVAPSMIILKPRNSADNWPVWHGSFAVNEYVYLNLTNAKTSLSTFMNGTLPSSTVISLGTWANTNTNTQTMVAYCFAAVAGYSAFGSYTGNGSADGPFVYTNHRPAFLLVKRTDTTSNWTILDFQREGYNVDNDSLFPNLSNAEGTTDLADLLSNGFKLRSTDASVNASGGTYIYMSLASNPFKFSLAR